MVRIMRVANNTHLETIPRPKRLWDRRFRPTRLAAIAIAALTLCLPTAATAAFERVGDTLHIEDDILRGDLFRFLEAFTDTVRNTDKDQDIALELNSDGGDLEAAFSIAEVITAARKGGYRVRASVPPGGRCNSACVVIFAAADHRTAASDAKFLLHGVRYAGLSPSPAVAARHGQLVSDMQQIIDDADPSFGSFVRRHKIIEHDLNMTFSARQLFEAFGGFITRLE